jgi:hypothetical protein
MQDEFEDVRSYPEKVAAAKCGYSHHTFKKWRLEGKEFPEMPVWYQTPEARGAIRYRHFQIKRWQQYLENESGSATKKIINLRCWSCKPRIFTDPGFFDCR